ncbi:hypothetical protein ACJX0J_027542, partial [Zea mays]
ITWGFESHLNVNLVRKSKFKIYKEFVNNPNTKVVEGEVILTTLGMFTFASEFIQTLGIFVRIFLGVFKLNKIVDYSNEGCSTGAELEDEESSFQEAFGFLVRERRFDIIATWFYLKAHEIFVSCQGWLVYVVVCEITLQGVLRTSKEKKDGLHGNTHAARSSS